MSLWNSIRGVLGSKPAAMERSPAKLYVVEGDRVADSRGGDRMGPVERVQVLQRLSQFSEREQVKIDVVLGGRALREVAYGEKFGPLTVYYAEQQSALVDQISKLFEDGGGKGSVVVIASDRQVEERIANLGGRMLRVSSLKKALEGGSGGGEQGGGRDNGGNRQQRNGGGRPRRGGERGDRGDRRDRRPQSQQPNQTRSENQSSQTEPGAETTVKNLIDLVE